MTLSTVSIGDIIQAADINQSINWLNSFALNVKDSAFGALGDGSHDDTAAIQAALDAVASAGGGTVFFPLGIYRTSDTLLITSSSTCLQGVGWGTVIQPFSGDFDAISTFIPTDPALAIQTWNVRIRDMFIDCGYMSGTVAGRGNGIHLYASTQATLDHVQVGKSPNYAIVLEGSAPVGGYNCRVLNCNIKDDNAGGLLACNSCEGNFITGTIFAGADGVLAAAQPAFYPQGTTGYAMRLLTGVNMVYGNVLGGRTLGKTQPAVDVANRLNKFICNKWDGTYYRALTISGDHTIIMGNEFLSCGCQGNDPAILLANGKNTIIGNNFANDGIPSTYTYAIEEDVSGPHPYLDNVITGNHFDPGQHASPVLLLSDSIEKVTQNPGIGYPQIVHHDRPIRYYRLNDPSGTAAHDLGSQATDGTLSGSVTLVQPALLSADATAKSMAFASSGYIDIPTTGLPTGASPWSVEFWLQQPVLQSAYQRPFSMGTKTINESVWVMIQSGNDIKVDFWGNDFGGGLTYVYDGGIYYVSITYDGTIASLYTYGGSRQGLIGSKALTLNMTYTGGYANLGTSDNGTMDPYTGRIAECAIYDYALSPKQIYTHYQVGMGLI